MRVTGAPSAAEVRRGPPGRAGQAAVNPSASAGR